MYLAQERISGDNHILTEEDHVPKLMYISFSVFMKSVLTSVNIDSSAYIHDIKAFIKQDVCIPPSLLPSV